MLLPLDWTTVLRDWLHQPALAPGQASWHGQRGAVTLSYDAERLRPTVEAIASRDHHDQPIVVYRLRLAASEPRAEEMFKFVFDISE